MYYFILFIVLCLSELLLNRPYELFPIKMLNFKSIEFVFHKWSLFCLTKIKCTKYYEYWGESLGIRVRQNRGLSFYSGKSQTGAQNTQKAHWVATGSCPPAAHCCGSTGPVPREGLVWRSSVHCGGQRREEIGHLACRGDNSFLLPNLGLLSRHSLLSPWRKANLHTEEETGRPRLLHPVLSVGAKDAPVGPE